VGGQKGQHTGMGEGMKNDGKGDVKEDSGQNSVGGSVSLLLEDQNEGQDESLERADKKNRVDRTGKIAHE
jgi:hypothetical protein